MTEFLKQRGADGVIRRVPPGGIGIADRSDASIQEAPAEQAMGKVFMATEEPITLHGLGFLQVPLAGDDRRRLHVWHPELPRRRCFAHSSIHNHRFGFTSQVVVGVQINRSYRVTNVDDMVRATHVPYLHEGERTPYGNRPWLPGVAVRVSLVHVQEVKAGQSYEVMPYAFHSTEPGGDGRVATIMSKTYEGPHGAQSLCAIGIGPDVDFDRKQWPAHRLWSIVREVLEGATRSAG